MYSQPDHISPVLKIAGLLTDPTKPKINAKNKTRVNTDQQYPVQIEISSRENYLGSEKAPVGKTFWALKRPQRENYLGSSRASVWN